MKKSSKKALWLSVISMLICVAMLVGTTFAWFTDSVTSGVNKIIAGNLDVDVTVDGTSIENISTLFNDVALWEPGAVAYENLTVENKGNLALIYKMSVNFTNENTVKTNGTDYGLSTALKVGVVEGGVSGERADVLKQVKEWTPLKNFILNGGLSATKTQEYGIVIYWEPTANDNNWNVNNGKIVSDIDETGNNWLHIDLGIELFATQKMEENDSFDNKYDANAIKDLFTNEENNELVEKGKVTDEEIIVADVFGTTGMPTGTVELTFDTYTFDASKFIDRYPVEDYGDYICDYWVSTSAPMELGTALVGNYGTFGWLGFNVPQNIDQQTNVNMKYEPTPLLHSAGMGNADYWNYENVIANVGAFICGIADNDGDPSTVANKGTEVTVELRMTNPNNANDHITITSITVVL